MANKTDQPLILGVDTQILVWGIRKEGDHKMMQRAKWLFEWLNTLDRGFEIIVPSIVLTEYLARIPEARREYVIASFHDGGFKLPGYDVDCVLLGTKLFEEILPEATRSDEGWKHKLRADTLIVATAKQKGATVFYSNDGDCRKAAERAGLEARDLPTSKHVVEVQTDMFD